MSSGGVQAGVEGRVDVGEVLPGCGTDLHAGDEFVEVGVVGRRHLGHRRTDQSGLECLTNVDQFHRLVPGALQGQPATEGQAVGESVEVARGGDEHSEAVTDLDDAQGLQNLERLPERVSADTQFLGQFGSVGIGSPGGESLRSRIKFMMSV